MVGSGVIKRQKTLIDGKFKYQVMLKPNGLFRSWYEEFSSFDREKTESIYYQILRSKNIEKEL